MKNSKEFYNYLYSEIENQVTNYYYCHSLEEFLDEGDLLNNVFINSPVEIEDSEEAIASAIIYFHRVCLKVLTQVMKQEGKEDLLSVTNELYINEKGLDAIEKDYLYQSPEEYLKSVEGEDK